MDRIDRGNERTRRDVGWLLKNGGVLGQDAADADEVEIADPGREQCVIERV